MNKNYLPFRIFVITMLCAILSIVALNQYTINLLREELKGYLEPPLPEEDDYTK